MSESIITILNILKMCVNNRKYLLLKLSYPIYSCISVLVFRENPDLYPLNPKSMKTSCFQFHGPVVMLVFHILGLTFFGIDTVWVFAICCECASVSFILRKYWSNEISLVSSRAQIDAYSSRIRSRWAQSIHVSRTVEQSTNVRPDWPFG